MKNGLHVFTIRRPAASSSEPAPCATPLYQVPTLPEDDPGREAYLLLGPAWRSPTARVVDTGRQFDVVRAPQQIAALALHQLRLSHAERCGAVSAAEGCWHFFVPLCSDRPLWPRWVTYLSGPTVLIPPRSARDDGLSLRWITRGAPTGRLLTDPGVLCPTVTSLAPSPSSGPAWT